MSVTLNKVLISDAVDPSCVQLLQTHGIEVTCKYKLPKEQLLQEIKGYDGLIVRSDTKVTADVLSAGTSLRVVGRAGTGVDNIDVAAATRKGIIVLNTPGGNSISACELTCAHITGLARNVAQACQSLKEGRWDRKLYTGSELSGKTLAILGLGRIGREVATRMQVYGMKTIGFDPIVSSEDAHQFNVEKMELDEIWPLADYITVHTPLIPQTRNLINDEVFNKCKKGVKIINVARGGIVDEAALLNALKDGRCGGAALDVFCEEPPKSATVLELIRHPAVIATPHLGASTNEAQQRVAVEIAEQFIALASNCSPEDRTRYSVTGVVNAPVIAAAMVQENLPWIMLAKGLGKLASKMLQGSVLNTNVSITTAGSNMKNQRFLETAVLVGVLSGHTKNGLNLINAPSLAQECGICTSQSHTKNEAKIDTVTVTVTPEKGSSCSLQGMVKDEQPYLLAINDASFGPAGLLLEENIIFFKEQNSIVNVMEIIKVLDAKNVQIGAMSTARGTSTWIAVRIVDSDVKSVSIPGVFYY